MSCSSVDCSIVEGSFTVVGKLVDRYEAQDISMLDIKSAVISENGCVMPSVLPLSLSLLVATLATIVSGLSILSL